MRDSCQDSYELNARPKPWRSSADPGSSGELDPDVGDVHVQASAGGGVADPDPADRGPGRVQFQQPADPQLGLVNGNTTKAAAVQIARRERRSGHLCLKLTNGRHQAAAAGGEPHL